MLVPSSSAVTSLDARRRTRTRAILANRIVAKIFEYVTPRPRDAKYDTASKEVRFAFKQQRIESSMRWVRGSLFQCFDLARMRQEAVGRPFSLLLCDAKCLFRSKTQLNVLERYASTRAYVERTGTAGRPHGQEEQSIWQARPAVEEGNRQR